jgi:hypothetical protein
MLPVTMDKPLHPNLARIAAAYDEVMQSHRSGLLPANEARRRVLTLIARDDSGLEWSINPDTGQWQYRTQFGAQVEANPPAYGVASFSPADLGSGSVNDDRVKLYEIDQRALFAPGQLRGSTMLLDGPGNLRRGRWGHRVRRGAILAAVVVSAGVTLLLLLR